MIRYATGLIATGYIIVACAGRADAELIELANSVSQFSGVQGQDGWYYGYVEPQSGPQFVEMPTYFFDGIRWRWARGDEFFTTIWAEGQHPNGPGGTQEAEQWAVRRWVSNASALVSISGEVGMYGETPTDADGVLAKVLVDGAMVFTEDISRTTTPHAYSTTASVNVGSVVDFLISPKDNSYNDATTFSASITTDMIPEPSTFGLLGAGAIGLLGYMRERRRRRSA